MGHDEVTHDIEVDASPATAFEAFTAHLGAWWPLAYTFSGPAFEAAAVEPQASGAWFERDSAGTVRPWGDVRAFTPGERLVLAFGIGPDRQPAPKAAASEVEVRFAEAGPGRARVAVIHRDFARHGEGAGTLRDGMDSPQGWPLILAELRRWIAARPVFRAIVAEMDPAVAFYTRELGFTVDMRPAPGFAALARGPLRLYLNEPGAGGAGASAADGSRPRPGGWNRLQLVFPDLTSEVQRLRDHGCVFRTGLVQGNGGLQILIEDPSGNVVELLEPKARRPA